MTKILYVQSSPRGENAVSRKLGDRMIEQLRKRYPLATVQTRVVSEGMPFITQEWITSAYTPMNDRTPEQHKSLSFSDQLIEELLSCDILVIATPMYNFSVPAALKAWFDMVIRDDVTFRIPADGGYQGLVGDRKTYVIVSTGGVSMGSSVDHLSPLVKTDLNFMGITSIEYIYAAGTNKPHAADILKQAEGRIDTLAHAA